jgi:N-acetyl-alpha-D-muramate 1-phosphate uridylyltransferase
MIQKAMLLAAGLGTRLKPWTDHHPKALAVVNGKSLLQRNIEYLQQYGIKEVVVNVHHFAQQIKDAIEQNNGWGSIISISDESEMVLETGGGVLFAKSFLEKEENFLVMNADMLTNTPLDALIKSHQENNSIATLAMSNRHSSRQLLWDENNILCGWQNNATGEQKIAKQKNHLRPMAFSGIQVIGQQFFSELSLQGKFSLIDAYLQLAPHHNISAYINDEAKLLDVGKPESLLLAQELFQ